MSLTHDKQASRQADKQTGRRRSAIAALALAAPVLRLAAPGLVALLLLLALLVGTPLLGAAARPVQGLLALALAGTLVAQPRTRQRARLLVTRGALHGWALAGVVGLALLLRAWGHRFGLPYFEHPDEWAVADKALAMVQTGDFNPRRFIYPNLFIYMQVPVVVVHFLAGVASGAYKTLDDIDKAALYPSMRLLTALLGTGVVLLTYLLGRLLYGRVAGLLAAAALAVLPSAVADAHYITTDTPAMFWSVLALLPPALLVVRPPTRWRDLVALALVGGLLVGLAASTKYNVAVLLLPLLLALWWAASDHKAAEGQGDEVAGQRSFGFGPLIGCVALALVGAVLGFTLGTPYWLAELPLFLNELASIIDHYRFKGHPGHEAEYPALFYAAMVYGEAALFTLLAGVGVALGFVRHRRTDLLLLAFLVPSYLQLAGLKVTFFRNAMPLLPIACLFAAVGFVALQQTASRWWGRRANAHHATRHALPVVIPLIIAAIALAGPLITSARETLKLARPTTRLLATDWMLANAPVGARVWLEDQTLILPPDRLRIAGGQPVIAQPLQWYRDQGYRYLVASVSGYSREERAQLEALTREAHATQLFDGQGERHGPALLVIDTGLARAADEPRTRADAPLAGGALLLDGYRHSGAVTAGDVLPLALYWRSVQPLGRDYVVFVHLLDAQGNRVAQRDVAPLEGSYPTSQWQVGELLRDDQDLAIPSTVPPGTYQLAVGMYDPATMQQLNSAPILIGPITVR
jgi:4-amino-4-deoxy-L-arabinose transferase-like glycosyltransferase